METNVVKERLAFVHDLESGHWSMTELCERYGVSRPTGYKWLARHQAGGGAGLDDRSRAPQRCPHRTSDALEALIIAARLEYGWGAKKLLRVLRTRHPSRVWPARSTVNAILERHGLLHKNRRRRKWAHPGRRPDRDAAAQSDLARGLQRPVPHGRRPVLLSAHRDRSLQPPRAGVPRPALREDRRREADLPRPVPRGGSAGRHPHRQRRAVRLDGHSRPGGAERLVDAARHRASAHHAGESARERHPRADASRAQARDRSPGRQQPARATASLRRLLSALQRRAAARRDRRPHAERPLVPLVAPVPGTPDLPRLPGAHGDPAREHGRHVPPASRVSRSSATPSAAKTSAWKKSAMAFGTSSITVRCSARSMNARRALPEFGPARKV